MNTPRHTLYLLRLAVALLFVSAFLSRCASMMTPTGGPRDSLPPVIVNMTPDNFATGRPTVGHEKIYIEFDEFVQLKDQQKEFFTSPAMKKKPTVTLRGRGIVIQLRDTLAPNTTYSLNFGSAIRDNNEGNPLYSMRYVFSTGPEIDSMVLSGYTADSYKADSVSKSFIWFFPADSVEQVAGYDSTIFKYKPAAIARAENNGIFIAQNLKPIPYRVYAVQDKNDNQMYEPGSDQVGFLEGTYNPAEMPDFGMWYDSIRRSSASTAGGACVQVETPGFSIQPHQYYRDAVEALGLEMKLWQYELNVEAAEAEAEQLRAYLKRSCRPGETIELWNLWVGDDREEKIARFQGRLGDLDREALEQLCDPPTQNGCPGQCRMAVTI